MNFITIMELIKSIYMEAVTKGAISGICFLDGIEHKF